MTKSQPYKNLGKELVSREKKKSRGLKADLSLASAWEQGHMVECREIESGGAGEMWGDEGTWKP